MNDTFENPSCGCCEGDGTTRLVENPPGLSAIAYRCGTHPTVLRRMLSRLASVRIESAPGELRHPLAALTARTTDDPSIALLDAWASVADVLSFYQERIANEGFLRTATERRSILELARLIGYELGPGSAASAYLAYSLDPAAGAPTMVTVPAGALVRSVPGQNELPQAFETTTEITARLEWNALRPRQMRPQTLALNGGRLFLLAVGAEADAGATLLDAAATHRLDETTALPSTGAVAGVAVETIYADGTSTNLRAGDVILLVGRRSDGTTAETLVRRVRRVQEENDRNRTRVEFDTTTTQAAAAPLFAGVRARASIRPTGLDSGSVDHLIVNQSWSERDLSAWIGVQGWNARAALTYIYGTYNNPRPKTQLAPGAPGAFAMRARLGFFGHNAPAFASLKDAGAAFVDWDAGAGLSVWRSSLKPAAGTQGDYHRDADCFLERSVSGITGDGWAVFERPDGALTPFRVSTAIDASLAGFGLSTKSTGLRLARADTGVGLGDNTTDKSESFTTRKTTAHVLSDRLTLTQLPIDAPLGRGTPEATALTLDRMVLDLREGQPVILTGERADLAGVTVSEVVLLDRVEHGGGFTTLHFASPGLAFQYVRSTVTLNANVASATHGERVTEVLGSGSGARAGQRFTLRKPPLTYTAAATESGSASSLEVRVNGVRWHETPHLLNEAADSETYQVRMTDDGRTEVIFGDGTHGARLPTGVENVVATYRSGIGAAGMVGADRLTLPMTRPLGIRAVTNPVAASGAADPESRDDARRNAPQTVLTMGRIVSLQDAEHFTRAFAGIGKARARRVWRAGTQWVHLTVAAEAPSPGETPGTIADHRVAGTSALGLNLAAAIARCKEPSLRIRVDTYQPVFFNVSANILLDERFAWPDVEASIVSAMRSQFSFGTRDFVEAVSVSHVVRVMQHVPGVVMVDVDALHRFDQPAVLPDDGRLVADDLVWPEGDAAPTELAQLLLVNPLGIALTRVPAETVTP